MTVLDAPTETVATDDAGQLLFREARQRRRRRWLVSGIVAAVVVVVLAVVAIGLGLGTGRGSHGAARPVGQPPTAPGSATGAVHFTLRPVLCYAPPPVAVTGQATTAPLPACAPASQLTATHLAVEPASGSPVHGYASNANIPADPQFATIASTPSDRDVPGATVLLPGSPGAGSQRFVLGPAALTGSSVQSASVGRQDGEWLVDITFTGQGAAQWNSLAENQFHAMIGVDVNGRVVSAPITQPTQSSFTSFGNRMQISGSFTEQQARDLAAGL